MRDHHPFHVGRAESERLELAVECAFRREFDGENLRERAVRGGGIAGTGETGVEEEQSVLRVLDQERGRGQAHQLAARAKIMMLLSTFSMGASSAHRCLMVPELVKSCLLGTGREESRSPGELRHA